MTTSGNLFEQILFKILNANIIFLFHGCLCKDYTNRNVKFKLKNISTVMKNLN